VTDHDPAIELLVDSRVFETVAGPAAAGTTPPLVLVDLSLDKAAAE
jgi:hypothetical protein